MNTAYPSMSVAPLCPRVVYQIPFSHYCEKVRWALQFKGLTYRVVDINPTGKQKLPQGVRKLYPIYEDQELGKALSDSTPIIKFLDAEYPTTPRLFPQDPQVAAEVESWCIKLDSSLGLCARRLAYGVLIPSKVEVLSTLFLGSKNIAAKIPGLRTFIGFMIGGLLTERFQIHRNIEDGIYAWAENTLLDVTAKLGEKKYLVGDQFTAADITLHSLLRPLKHVPYIRQNPNFEKLFALQETIFTEHGIPVVSQVDALSNEIRDPSVLSYLLNPFAFFRDIYVKNRLVPQALTQIKKEVNPKLNVQYKKKSENEADNDQHIPGAMGIGERIYQVFVGLHTQRFIRHRL